MNIVSDLLGILLPPFRGLKMPFDYRLSPLAARLAGNKVLAVAVGEEQAVAVELQFARNGEFTCNPLTPQASPGGKITVAHLNEWKRETKSRLLAVTFGAGPEQSELQLLSNFTKASTEAIFQAMLHHEPHKVIKAPKPGMVYRGIQNPDTPAGVAIVGTFSPEVDSSLRVTAGEAGFTLVRTQCTILQLLNIGLADAGVRAGIPLLVIDQGQAAFVSVNARGAWETCRFRALRQGQNDLADFVAKVVRPGATAGRLAVIDTQSSKEIDVSAAVSGFEVTSIVIASTSPVYWSPISLAAA